MRIVSIAPLAAALFAAFSSAAAAATTLSAGQKISGPHVHENVAIYFIHGPSASGAVPLTLSEALAKGRVQVIETGRVNELQIENTGDEPVFVQAGDIVKGGKQDRVLTISLMLPPNSGLVGISSFCVEQGRWSARGKEDHGKFTSAADALPSSRALAIMAAPPEHSEAQRIRPAGRAASIDNDVVSRQHRMWESVAKVQADLSAGLNARVAAPESATSLQLSLENERLREARAAYIAALEPRGLDGDDVLGFVVAINGKPASGNVYPTNGLFRKMWSKQLAAAVTEAISEKLAETKTEPPTTGTIEEFLAAAEAGAPHERETALRMRQETRDAAETLYNETRTATGEWLHRAYVRK